MRLLVTRPEPEASALAETLRAAGHEVIVEPMLVVEPTAGVRLPLDGVDALIVTSANALRALEHHAGPPQLTERPLFAVGAATADLARRMGFQTVTAGPGTAVELAYVIAATLPPGSTLLHLAGDVLAADIAAPMAQAGLAIRVAVVYQTAEKNSFGAATEDALRNRALDGVTLLSPRTARVFARLCAAAGVSLEGVTAYCLSDACARAITGSGTIRIAEQPTLAALLALITDDTAQLPARP